MPSSQEQQPASPTSPNSDNKNDRMTTHEPPKLKTILKTPPKQATNPLQFIKVGPCSLYRSAQEQIQKVQDVKKIKQELRDDPEDWQSNLDNWKSSRRKRQEHIIERVVEVKKLELEEFDRQRRRSKTFSEMMEERGNRGRNLSISLAIYQEEDSNDLSDLGIGTSSGKSSVSGDTHDDSHSVLSDRDSELEKSHSDVDNASNENGHENGNDTDGVTKLKNTNLNNGFIKNNHNNQEYDSATTATASSPEPEEYTYEGAIRGYVSRVAQNIPRGSLADLDAKLENVKNSTSNKINKDEKINSSSPVVKIDILKRREIFEKGTMKNNENNNNNFNNNKLGFTSTKTIKERLSSLERQKIENNDNNDKEMVKNSRDLSREKSVIAEELESVRPLRERLSSFEKLSNSFPTTTTPVLINSAKEQSSRIETSTSSERSSSPDSEYRGNRTTFHQSLDSLDADASSGPDTFERVQSLEEFDLTRNRPASSSSTEVLNETDREDSGIHTTDVSCSVSQTDEPIIDEEKTIFRENGNISLVEIINQVIPEEKAMSSDSESDQTPTKEPVEITEDTSNMYQQQQVQQQQQQQQQQQSKKQEIQDENNEESTMKKTILVIEDKRSNHEIEKHDEIEEPLQQVALKEQIAPPPPQRPTTLMLKKNLSTDFLSPLSPVSKQILPLSFSSDEEIVSNLAFPMGPPTSAEPPKEKPPPPPTDLSDEENLPIEPLKRFNSTKRIKKEIRSRRSDFLGIEGINDDELERELCLTKPPDMAAILAEERRIEQLHRRSYDTDSNYEQDSSHERDSGVELGHIEDWTKQTVSPDMSEHSRQSSEPFGASVTSSEEDEITKKEREIIDVLEKEEQWRYENNRQLDSDIGEKLAYKLKELEEEKMQLERQRATQEAESQRRQEEETLRKNEENLRKQEEIKRKQQDDVLRQQELQARRKEEEIRIKEQEEMERRIIESRRQEEKQIRNNEKLMQETKVASPIMCTNDDEYASREVLRVERELLQLEQEELKRQRNNLAYREQKQQQLVEQLEEQWKTIQDANHVPPPPRPSRACKPQPPVNYRSSLPNLQMQEGQRRRQPPPPPIPPAKPLRLVERQRDITIKNSRLPSADSIPQLLDAPLRPNVSSSQQMTRQTLQALSAVPRPRIVQGDQWLQRRKSDVPRTNNDYNYQHWLVQEAEQRRINEKNQRSPPARKPQHVTGTSVPYTASPIRNDNNKPLPDSIIQKLTQRVQNRVQDKPLPPRRRLEHSTSQEHLHTIQNYSLQPHKIHQSTNNINNINNNSNNNNNNSTESQEKMLSVSGKKKCSHCGDELGRGAAMIIESLRLFYHMECFKCCVCHVRLGDGLMGTDVRVRNHKLHCHNCYSSDDGVKFSCV